MAGQIVKCTQCGTVGTSKLKGNGWITFILILFYIIPGLIYMVWRRNGLGACPSCSSDKVILNSAVPSQPAPYVEASSEQVRCPECRELIRYDAKKCKHCGSAVSPSA